MLNFLLVLIHHPLAALAFAIWHLFAWSGHGTAVFHSALKTAGFHEDDFKAFNKAWHLTDDDTTLAEALDDVPLAKAEVVPEVVFTTTPDAPKHTEVTTPYPPSFCGPGARDEDHIGKWRRGDADLRLHYVCETQGSSDECDDGWESFEGKSGKHCYKADLIWPVPLNSAEMACRYMNSHLVVIESEAENKFVQELVGRNTVWIGLSMVKGSWIWSTGTQLSYTNWDKLQPESNVNSEGMNTEGNVVYMNYWKALCMPPPWWINSIPPAMIGLFVLLATIMLTLVCVATFAPCCFACVYKQRVSDKREAIPGLAEAEQRAPHRNTFEPKILGCFEDMDVFWHACCCSLTRVADTHHAAGTMKFWQVFLWWIGASVVGGIFGGGTGFGKVIAGVIVSIVMMKQRQKLKAKLGIDKGSSFEDFLLWWCFSPCAAVQEARAIDNAAGVTVKCCCSLTRRQPSPESMVGAPVAAGSAPLAQPLQASPQITLVNLPAVAPQQTYPAMTHQNLLPAEPPRAMSHTSMISMQEIQAAQPAPPQLPVHQPTVAQVVSITPPGGQPTPILLYTS